MEIMNFHDFSRFQHFLGNLGVDLIPPTLCAGVVQPERLRGTVGRAVSDRGPDAVDVHVRPAGVVRLATAQIDLHGCGKCGSPGFRRRLSTEYSVHCFATVQAAEASRKKIRSGVVEEGGAMTLEECCSITQFRRQIFKIMLCKNSIVFEIMHRPFQTNCAYPTWVRNTISH